MDFIDLTNKNIDNEHICCAFSDKKCAESYEMKKNWLREEFKSGYRFYRLNERAKVFIEYGPSESAWLPITADNYFNINCFWVSGKYKGQGNATKLLARAEADARENGRNGLVTVTGKKKFHFMSDGKWFLNHGFEVSDETDTGFVLLTKRFSDDAPPPSFNPEARSGLCPQDKGLVVYYSNRCPFAEYHVTRSLRANAEKFGFQLTEIKLETLSDAIHAPSPATIFSLFNNGRFITTDVSICLDKRFAKEFSA